MFIVKVLVKKKVVKNVELDFFLLQFFKCLFLMVYFKSGTVSTDFRHLICLLKTFSLCILQYEYKQFHNLLQEFDIRVSALTTDTQFYPYETTNETKQVDEWLNGNIVYILLI